MLYDRSHQDRGIGTRVAESGHGSRHRARPRARRLLDDAGRRRPARRARPAPRAAARERPRSVRGGPARVGGRARRRGGAAASSLDACGWRAGSTRTERCGWRRSRERSTAPSCYRTRRSTLRTAPGRRLAGRAQVGRPAPARAASMPSRRRPLHCSSRATAACSRRRVRTSSRSAADGVLRTPPADGSILPGVTRARAIALVRELGVDGARGAADACAAVRRRARSSRPARSAASSRCARSTGRPSAGVAASSRGRSRARCGAAGWSPTRRPCAPAIPEHPSSGWPNRRRGSRLAAARREPSADRRRSAPDEQTARREHRARSAA